MDYENLLNKSLIKQFKASPTQAASRIALAKRDINAASAMMPIDRDWAFSIAYNSILQATRTLLFAKGYRPAAGEGQHKVAVEFAEIALGKKFQDEIYIFDKMRSKRHRVIYDVLGLVSQEEAKQAFDFSMQGAEQPRAFLFKITSIASLPGIRALLKSTKMGAESAFGFSLINGFSANVESSILGENSAI